MTWPFSTLNPVGLIVVSFPKELCNYNPIIVDDGIICLGGLVENLKISEIDYFPVAPRAGHIGFVSLVVNDALFLGSIAVYTCLSSEQKIRLVFPDRVLPNGRRINIFHPTSRLAEQQITDAVISKLNELFEKVAHGGMDQALSKN